MDEATALYREWRSRLRPLRGGLRDLGGALMSIAVERRWRARRPGRAHALPNALIVSLTSYRPRFPTLERTLKCLLTQSAAPDGVVLWIAHADIAALPAGVRALQHSGLTIRPTEDIGSFKKIVPALRAYPDAFIATADDDVYYPANWLEELIDGLRLQATAIPSQRVHKIALDAAGAPMPYMKWTFGVKSGAASALNVATGVGGVLYPPGSLHPDVLDEAAFLRLCPTSDDLWLYWMARRAGWSFRKVGPPRRFLSWPGSQNVALQHVNAFAGGKNDVQFARLTDRFGLPFERSEAAGAQSPPRARRARLSRGGDLPAITGS